MFVESSQSEHAGADALHQAIDVARRGLELGATASTNEVFESLRPAAYLHLALSYDQLGQQEEAMRWCKKALELDANNFDALMLHGYITYDAYPPADKQVFRENKHRKLVECPVNVSPSVTLMTSK